MKREVNYELARNIRRLSHMDIEGGGEGQHQRKIPIGGMGSGDQNVAVQRRGLALYLPACQVQ